MCNVDGLLKKLAGPVHPHVAIQQFVQPRCKKAYSFIRFTYCPAQQSCHADVMNNLTKAFDRVNEVDEKIDRYFPSKEKSVTYSKQGSSVAEYASEAKKLVHFMLHVLSVAPLWQVAGIRVSKIVVDFVRDRNKLLWLFNLRSFEVDSVCYDIKQNFVRSLSSTPNRKP